MDFGWTSVYWNDDIDMDGAVYSSDYDVWAMNFGITNPLIFKPYGPTYISRVPGDR